MTNIVGKLGYNFNGIIRWEFAGVVVDETTNPVTTYLPNITQEAVITNGVININIPQTELLNVSVHFTIYRVTESIVEFPAIIEFDYVVENTVTVEFSDILPTGIVNTLLDTSANRIARIIANTPELADKVRAIKPRGDYEASALYSSGDMVSYLNRNYINKSPSPIQNILPTQAEFWYEFKIILPEDVAGLPALGDTTPYGAGWINSGLSPSQGILYDKLTATDSAITARATVTQLNSEVSTLNTNKANKDDVYIKSAVDNLLLSKANTSALDLKADVGDLNLKANILDAILENPSILANPAFSDNSLKLISSQYLREQFKPFALLTRTSTNQSIPHNTTTTLTWQTALFDTDNIFNLSTGVGTIPVGKGGLYFITMGLYFNFTASSAATVYIKGYVYINGNQAATLGAWLGAAIQNTNQGVNGSRFFNLSPGDTLSFRALVFHGGTGASINTFSTDRPYACLIKVPTF